MRFTKAALAFVAFAAFAAPMTTATAQTPPPSVDAPRGTMLQINAEGTSEARPDMATINLGVTTEGQTAQAALQENARRMSALNQALRRAGVADRDIQTSNVSVHPQQQYREGQEPLITGYQANNTVNARVRNVNNLGRVIDAAVAAGGNTIHGVNFSHQNADAQLDAARRNAIAEARRRADLYASALNMRVVGIIAVSEGGGYSPPIPMPMMAARNMAQDASTPISPGEIETRVSVSVTFELR